MQPAQNGSTSKTTRLATTTSSPMPPTNDINSSSSSSSFSDRRGDNSQAYRRETGPTETAAEPGARTAAATAATAGVMGHPPAGSDTASVGGVGADADDGGDDDVVVVVESKGQLLSGINPLGLEIRYVPERGNGVFASRDISPGTVLEESPVLVITKQQWEEGKMNDCIFGEYAFCWGNGGQAIGLGLASLFNHSAQPNVNFIRDTRAKTITFKAFRSIQKGEELCICYNADSSKLWFLDTSSTSAAAAVTTGSDGPMAGPSSASATRDDPSDTDIDSILPSLDVLSLDDEADPVDLPAASAATAAAVDDAEVNGTRVDDDVDASTFPSILPTDLIDQSEHVEREIKRAQRLKRMEAELEIKSFKEVRQQKALEKKRNLLNGSSSRMSGGDGGDDIEIQSPQPVPFTHPITPVPKLTQDIPTALPASTLGSLPAPLHSTPTPSPNTPPDITSAQLVDDLDWDESHWKAMIPDSESSKDAIARLGHLTRVKGHVEQDEEEEYHGLMDVWAVDVEDPRTTRFVLTFSKDMEFNENSMRHLKRVTRRQIPDSKPASICLCTTSYMSREAITSHLSNFHPTLKGLEPYVVQVPRAPARTMAEVRSKALIWPVVFSPSGLRPSDWTSWSLERKSWVKAGIDRVISLALQARSRGDLPVGVFCTSPPESQFPNSEGFIPPTPDLRASATDTRMTTHHPLRHSILNCVRSIAYLRTVPPFSDLQPTRNGADYLLTSLSLFVTHEPCTMCAMALLHSRVREVFYVFDRKRGGGFGEMGVHGRKDLNHRFEVWKWEGELGEGVDEALQVDEELAI